MKANWKIRKKPLSKAEFKADEIMQTDFGITYEDFNKAQLKNTCESRILTLLKSRAYNITEIALLLNTKYATIQANLSRMIKKRLVVKKKEGRKAYYGIRTTNNATQPSF